MIDKDELRKMFPAQVLKPELTGEFYILQHWTEWEQNHMILARSREGLVKTFERICVKNEPSELKEFCRIEIVAPPLKLRDQYAQDQWEREVNDFWQDMYFDLCWNGPSGSFRTSGKLPHQLKWCGCKGRFNCKQCHQGLAPKEGTLESLYSSARVKYLTSKGKEKDLETKPCLIKARDLMPGEKLSMLEYSPGHHSSGMSLVSEPHYFNSYTVAFCVVKEKFPYEFYNSMVKYNKLEEEALRKQQWAKHTVERKSQHLKTRKKAFDFFASL
jgi:hypothetical protein